MRKILSLIPVFILLITTNVFANDGGLQQTTSNTPQIIETEYATITISDIEGNVGIMPLSETIHFHSAILNSNFDQSLTLDPKNGKNFNFYTQNDSPHTVQVNVSIGGVPITGYPLSLLSGKQATFSSSGITYVATWRFTVNQTSGAALNGNVLVRARQWTS